MSNLAYAAQACESKAQSIPRLEALNQRIGKLNSTIAEARNRLDNLADRLIGLPPPTPATPGIAAAPAPLPDACVRRLELQIDDSERLASMLHDQIDRLGSL